MAICILNKNLTRENQCNYSLPQIDELYLVNKDGLSGDPVVTYGTGTNLGCDEITAINFKADDTDRPYLNKVYKVQPAKGSASFEDTLVVEDNGSKYRNASITFNVVGTYDSCMHGALDALALGRYFVVIKTVDGNYLGMGRIAPLEAQTATLAGGADTNGLQIVLAGNIAESPIPLSADAIQDLEDNLAA